MKNLESLIVKYLEGNLIKEEAVHLEELLKKNENKVHFKEFIHLKHLINSKTEFNYEKELSQFKRKANKTIKLRPLLKYAAAILIFASAGYFFLAKDKPSNEPSIIIVNNNIKAGTDKATLTLDDGTNVVLEKGQQYNTENLNSTGEKLVYNTPKYTKSEIIYNYLTIPRGGQYFVKLSDGTQVWLNSESQLKYPVSFKAGETRKVELIYGEAYFDVSPSIAHQGSVFKVYNKKQEIQVLGTTFNIRAYQDEAAIYTTLVEGKVSISTSTKKEMLIPNQQSKVNIIDNEMTLSVVDVNNIISWKDGIFDFEGKSLKEIMKVLSRWYDMEVEFENEALKQERFNGRIKKSYSIEDILTAIKNTNIIKNYEINNKKVILK
tara:strand:- start:8901 stop:10034 length:1134 start_codon:yes stop_codon:yes gene_type:complete